MTLEEAIESSKKKGLEVRIYSYGDIYAFKMSSFTFANIIKNGDTYSVQSSFIPYCQYSIITQVSLENWVRCLSNFTKFVKDRNIILKKIKIEKMFDV